MPTLRRNSFGALLGLLAGVALAGAALAQTVFPTPQGNQNAPGSVDMCPTAAGVYVPCGQPGALPKPVAIVPQGIPIATSPSIYPFGSIPIAGNAAGSTGAVVGTLAARPGALTYICGFNVQAIGGTAAVGPITIAGLVGASQVYQASASAAGGTVAFANFTPCIPASAINTAITITTTADGTATAVNVNSWGFQL